MKRIVCILSCLLILVPAFSMLRVQALSKTEAKVTIKTQKSTFMPGEEISAVVNVSCGTDLKSFNLNLVYDKNILEFEESKTKRINGVNGDFQKYVYSDRLRVTYDYRGSGTILSGESSDAITLVFTVKKNASEGTTSITPSAGTVINDNSSSTDKKPVINKEGKSCKVTYKAARLTISSVAAMKANAKLSSLTVKGCTLQPKFDPDVTSYRLYVPEKVVTITPKAVTVNTLATVKIEAKRKNNVVTTVEIKVTAADETTTKTYELTIRNGDPPASDETDSSKESSSKASSSSEASLPSSSEASSPSSAPSSSSAASSQESSTVGSSESLATVTSVISSDLPFSSAPQGFWGSLTSQVSALPKNGPMLLLMALLVILVLLLAVLPISKRKKRNYIHGLLQRGYIINPQLYSMNGGSMPMQDGQPVQGMMYPAGYPSGGENYGMNPPPYHP